LKAWLEKRWEGLRQREERLATARVVIFLVGLALVTALVVVKSILASEIASLTTALFIFFVVWHAKVAKAMRRNFVELELWRREEARSLRNWKELPPLPMTEKLPRFFSDLDLVGERSVLRLIQSGISSAGFTRLLEKFRQEGMSSEQIRLRQEQVKALSSLTVLRRRLLREARVEAGTLLDLHQVEKFLDSPFHSPDAPRWVAVLAGLQGLALVLAVLYVVIGIPPVYALPWFLSFFVFSFTYPKFFDPFGRAITVEGTLHRFGALLKRVENFRLRPGNPLADLFAPFQGDHRPSRSIRKISFYVNLLSIRSHPFLYVLIHMVFPWDFVIGLRLEKLRGDLRADIARWAEAFSELEALLSLAEFARAFPHARYPEILPGEGRSPRVRADKLKHPLIPEAEAIGNGLDISEKVWCRLITGSNMSGKSTYLRTVGVNVLLAQAGAPVFADSMELAPCRVFTMLRVVDSIEDHISSFYAEVKGLKEIWDEAKREGAPPVLYLVDEIFRGTNNRERLQGSRAYLKALLPARAGGLVATHDLELAEIAQETSGIENFHFKESIVGKEMRFSYQLENGPCPTTNALKIMELAGLPT